MIKLCRMRHILWASKALVQLNMRRFYQEHPAPRVGGGAAPFRAYDYHESEDYTFGYCGKVRNEFLKDD